MLKTERLYYTDCYLREFEARVLEVEPDPRGFRVYLDRTAFYPESGGQPMDRGTLAGIPALEVADEGEAVAHVLAHKPESQAVKGEIDWARRFDHMQQHTGQHVLSAAFGRTGQFNTVSFHLGAESSTIELESDRLGRRQIDEAEESANRVVFEDREVRFFFRPAEEVGTMDLRKPSAREGMVRLVEVEDFDLSACGGTHVRRTGAIGLIAVRRFERTKGHTRVEFVCGSRALRSARQDFLNLSEAARLLSTSLEQTPGAVAKHVEELKRALGAHEKLLVRLAEIEARDFWQKAPEKNGRKVVRRIFSETEQREAKLAAHALSDQPSAIGLIGVKGNPATLFFSQSAGGPGNVGDLLKKTVARFGGKGGGGRDFAQGGGLGEEVLEEALRFAESLL